MQTLSNFFGAIMQFFRFKADKQALDNAPNMQARAAGATDQQIKDAAAKNIGEGNLDQIRKDLAE
ncbi:MAG: hypothetical protein HY302_09325 [Opitutae bacterium]|nr:hypothetical protein [Opitutae bacterium]